MEKIERYREILLGLVRGDALGTTLEFKSPGTFKPVTDIKRSALLHRSSRLQLLSLQ
jgi:hypothetical protein